jgi:hypothetical protein
LAHSRALLICAAISAGAAGCRATDIPGADGNNADSEGGHAWLTGDWTGLYEGKGKNSSLDEDEKVPTSGAIAWFKASDDSTESDPRGTFRIELTDIDNAYVTGKYRDFQNTSLQLTIDESTLSSIGVSGKTSSMDYDLLGSDLALTTRKARIELTRKTDADKENEKDKDGDDGKDDGDTPAATIVGTYSCKDQAAHDWRIVIPDAGSFSIAVSGDGLSSLTMSGSLQIEPESSDRTATLTINSSSESKYEGTTLALYRIDDRTMDIARIASDGGQLSRFACNKE